MRTTGAFVLLAIVGVVYSLDTAAVARFADKNWNCVTAACNSRVNAGTFQSQYQCAEFVSRSIAAGGAFPNLSPSASQGSYGNYKYNGKTYNLNWVSSVQGGPLGMEDALKVLGWKNIGKDCKKMKAGYVGICPGSNGPHSHTFVGVGENLADAHNSARYHQSGCFWRVEAIYAPPGNAPPPTAPPPGCKGVYTVEGSVNLRDKPSINGAVVATMTSGSTVYDMDGTTVAADNYNWRHIQYKGKLGYAADSLLTKSGECTKPKTAYCVTADPNLRLRAEACTTASQLTVIPKGAAVTSLSNTLTSGCGYKWRKVDFNGIQGFAADNYLEVCTPLGRYDMNETDWSLDPLDCANPIDPESSDSAVFAGLLMLALVLFTLF